MAESGNNVELTKRPTARLYDARSGQSSDLALQGAQFETEPKEHVIHRAVVAELDARRRYTASTKGRSEIKGSGRKLYRQKGTGRARAGDIKPPNRVGGGTWGGPKPKGERSRKRINKKEAQAAFRGALSAKAADGELFVLDSLGFDAPSTKAAKAVIDGMDLTGPILVVITEDDTHAERSFRNLADVTVVGPWEYGVYELLRAREVVFSRAAYEKLTRSREEVQA